MAKEKPLWIYRFDNNKRAFGLLREAIEVMQPLFVQADL